MMDQDSIDSVMKLVTDSDMLGRYIDPAEAIPVDCEPDGRYSVTIALCDSMVSQKARLSEAWVGSNILMFAVLDGCLENRRSLAEGESFSRHYSALPQNDDIQIVEKNCYRLMKIIRNGIQHRLSAVKHDSGNYDIDYTFRNTRHALKISARGTRLLYTSVVNIINSKILGIPAHFTTRGHYAGIMRGMYYEMLDEISELSDEYGAGKSTLVPVSPGLMLRTDRRVIRNPAIIREDNNSIVFRHIDENFDYGESEPYYVSSDYTYGGYLLPQEAGTVIMSGEQRVRFSRSIISDEWRKTEREEKSS